MGSQRVGHDLVTERQNIIKCRNILRNEYWKEAFIVYNDIEYMNVLTSVKGNIRKILGKG